MSEQTNKPHRAKKEKKKHSGGPNPKAFAFAAPGRLERQARRSHDVKEKRLHVPMVDRLPEEAPPIIVAVVGPPGVGKTTLIKSLIRRYTKQTISQPQGPLTVVTSKRRRLTFVECPSDSLASMIDIAKVVDIVLLMVDGNYGFEMETMEFLNILASSGMPGNVFGILTHLDLFRKQDALRAQKKRLKHRFWSELYQGAKLFYLSGVVNGRYPDREILNLSRFLSVMKNTRPLVWRNSHPYCLADRFLDLTPPTALEENSKCDRTIALYGYLRGTNFPAQDARVHIPGVGDLNVSIIEPLSDPCPTPYMDEQVAKATGKAKSRRLGEKQKVLFAPMSDVGGVLVDKDAVYIDVKTSNFDRENMEEERGLGEHLVMGLQGERRLLGGAGVGMRLFSGGELITSDGEGEEQGDGGRKSQRRARMVGKVGNSGEDVDEEFESGEDEDEDEDAELTGGEADEDDGGYLETDGLSNQELGKGLRTPNGPNTEEADDGDVAFADSDSDLGSMSSVEAQELEDPDEAMSDFLDEDDAELRWKMDLVARARELHGYRRPYRTVELARLMYNDSLTPAEVIRRWRREGDEGDGGDEGEDEDEEEEDFFKKAANDNAEGSEDRMVPLYDYEALEKKWKDEDNLESLRLRFASAKLLRDGDEEDDEDGDLEGDEDLDGSDDEEDEGDGAFEDLETGEKFGDAASPEEPEDEASAIEAERERNARRKEELKLRFEEEDREGLASGKVHARREGGDGDGEFGEDEWYEAQKALIQKQLDINKAEFEQMDEVSRVQVEGYRAGTYARIVLENVPYEFSASFNPRFPVIVGGLTPTEDRFGFLQVRIKRHRWHKKILKTNDPLIFSLGWRRFQTLPIYSTSDSRTRNRMLKYTPEHMHCMGTFYGPLIAPNTGFCCVQSLSGQNPGFRIAATGVVENVDESTEIVKKLKLVGYPYKIFKNTAFIRDMFNSALEIAKFEGASIKTVSGVRGQIKRALSKPDGHFRATFEDRVLMSDIVFLRAWYPIKPHRYYNPVTNLLSPDAETDGSGGWQGMRLTGEVRRAQGVPTPQAKNSAYRPVERQTRRFNPLRVPRKLAADLPFKSQPAITRPQTRQTYLQKRAVVATREERAARNLMQQVMTLRNDKIARRRAAQEKRREGHRKKVSEEAEKRAEREKRAKQEYWEREGKKRKNQDASGGGGKRRK